MSQLDVFLWVAYVAALPLVLLPATIAGGWFIRYSSVPEDWRARWNIAKQAAEAVFVKAWGDDPLTPPPFRARLRSWPSLARLKFYGAMVCGNCFGWHLGYLILVVQAVVAAVTSGRSLVGWAEAVLVIPALWGWHTMAFKKLETKEWFTKT